MVEKQELFVNEDDTLKEVIGMIDRTRSKSISIEKEGMIIKTSITKKKIRDSLMKGMSDDSPITKIINNNNNNNKLENDRVLIVGGAGYLGVEISQKLLNKGYKVRILDSLIFGEKSITELKENSNFELIKEDIRNIKSITTALKGVDTVILLAGIVGDPATSKIPKETIESNFLATMTLARACKYYQINRFIFASTCSVYGTNLEIVKEDDALNPLSLYARLKIESEKNILSLKDENFSPTILRMATLYGLSKRMRFDLVINIFALKATTGQKISIFGGDQWRPFISVQDAAESYVKCLEAPIEKIAGEVFNVGAYNLTINNVKDVVKDIFPNIEVENVEKEVVEGAIDSRNYKVSFEKIQKAIGFKSSKSIKEAIIEIKEYIEQGNIIDIEKNIYYNVRMTDQNG